MTKCVGCRVRHLTCDALPTCIECEKSGRECTRLNVRFKHLVCPSTEASRADYSKYEFFFDGEQTWIEINGKTEFVPEFDSNSGTLIDELESNAFNATETPVQVRPERMQQLSPAYVQSNYHTPIAQALNSDDDPPDYLSAMEQNDSGPSPSMLPKNMPGEATDTLCGAPEQLSTNSNSQFPETELLAPGSSCPLKSLRERNLFRRWTTQLAPWFDVGDSKSHFGKVATCMAASSPLLMAVILAIAALHESRRSGRDDLREALTYHYKCVSMMVPMLSDPDRAKDDCVLITTTVLHLYGGIESGNDLPTHLEGTSKFFPKEALCDSTRLRRAVFWLHLRQEIYNAYLYQRGVITDLSNCNLDFEAESVDDDTWFHQTLYIAAEVSVWAFGDDASYARWCELTEMVEMWESRRASSFDPIYFCLQDPESGRYFPEIGYVTDEHVAAAHFIHLAKLLLATHDPKLPRIGPRKKSAAAEMQETALGYVRTLVGIATCNEWVPARFTAILAVIMCDSWFTGRPEQEAILDFLHDTSRRSGWSRWDAQHDLIKEWGWKER